MSVIPASKRPDVPATHRSVLGPFSSLPIAVLVFLSWFATPATAQRFEWPAEAETEATNLSELSPDFRQDLSGAVWNPITRMLWICRNGPGEESRLWALEEDGAGQLRIATQGERLAEWKNLGDSEGVTFADFTEPVVYVIVEGEESIHELDVSTFGERVLRQVFDLSQHLPLQGSAGAEGITFVPDRHLARAGFVDAGGSTRTSQRGMDGLMFVGHQNGGGLFAFDLDRSSGEFDFVGEYRVPAQAAGRKGDLSKVVALEFDRSTSRMYVWHGLRDENVMSVLELGSQAVEGETFRRFEKVQTYQGPSELSYEGLALVPTEDCDANGRSLYLTVDDGKAASLLRYDDLQLGCLENPAVQPAAGDSDEDDVDGAASTNKPGSADVWKMLFSLVGGLGIFLVGMRNLSEGMQAIAGSRLRQMISAVTNNRLLAVGVGTGVTCLVQSSSITTVIVVGFVNSGLMQLKQAIGVIMGANIGTTITGWILVLKVGKYGLPILGLSAFFYLFSKRDRWRYIAMATMGLGMIFFGLELMKNGVKPMRDVPAIVEAFAWFSADGYLGVLKCAAVGCILTFLLQSSSATLGITISLAITGTIPFPTAAALVLGENVGTTITAWLASLGATTVAKRAAYAHVAFNLIGVAWITLLFGTYIQLIGKWVYWESGVDVFAADFVLENPNIAFATVMTFAIASVHTGFNVANTALFVGFLPQFARLLERFMPDRAKAESPKLVLDHAMFTSPVLSIENSHRAIVKMAHEVNEMLDWTRDLIFSPAPAEPLVQKVFQYEARMDDLQAEVIEFLTELLTAETPHEVAVEARQQLRIVDEYESISDYISSILKARLRMAKHDLMLAPDEAESLAKLHDQVTAFVRWVTLGFEEPRNQDLTRAISDSVAIKRACKDLRNAHLHSLSQGRVEPIQSMAFSTMLNGFRKVKDHALNIAESMAAH